MDSIRPIGRSDRTVQPVELPRLTPLQREEERERREQARKRRQQAREPREGGADESSGGLDVRA